MNVAAPPLGSSELPQRKRASARQILSHTGIRGIAALLVVAYHQELGQVHRLPFETATFLFRRSYLMVDLFFVLSGFIISYVYAADRPAPMSKSEAKSFFFTRFARIYPLHLFALLLTTCFFFGQIWITALAGRPTAPLMNQNVIDWILQLFLIHAWFSGHVAWNIPSWSISAEMFAYLLFPAVVAFRCRSRIAAALTLLCVSLAFYAYVITTSGSLDIVAGLSPFRCVAGFGLGMLVYFNRSVAEKLPVSLLTGVQLAGLAWAVSALVWRVSDPIIVPAFVLIVWSTWTDRGLLPALLSTRPAQWLGEISYSVYLIHAPLLGAFFFFWSHFSHRLDLQPDLSRLLWLCLSFSLALGVSTLTYKYIEVPARRYLLEHWKRRRPPAGDKLVAAP